jgi:hypothetical protein
MTGSSPEEVAPDATFRTAQGELHDKNRVLMDSILPN